MSKNKEIVTTLDDGRKDCVKCGGKFYENKMGKIVVEYEGRGMSQGSELYCIHCMPLYDKKVCSEMIYDGYTAIKWNKVKYYQYVEVNENGKLKNR